MTNPFLIDYLFSLRWSICLSGILLLIFLWVTKPKKEIKYLWIILVIGIFTQVRFGTLHNGFLLHDHDCIHYQIGSKYFKEFGYNGMYAGVTQALTELNSTFPNIEAPKSFRDLDNKTGPHLNADHPKTQEIRGKFTDERWQELKSDILEWQSKHEPNWQHIVRDAGYNPPPAWTIWGISINKLISTKNSILFGIPDFVILAIVFYLILSVLGLRVTLYTFSTMMLFPGGTYAPFDWVGGSLFRYLWFLWLTIGLLAYYKGKYRLAGFALALGAMERIFPGAWLASAGLISLFHLVINKKEKGWSAFEPAKGLIIGGIVGISTVLMLTHLIIGSGAWGDFITHIKEHGSYLFTNHIGWVRAVTFHPHMGEMGFSSENMSIFEDWNSILLQRKSWLAYLLLRPLLLIAMVYWAWTCTKKSQEALAIAWLGSALVFFFSMPAHYYLLGLLPILAITAANSPRMFLGTLIMIALINALTQMSETVGWALASISIVAALSYGLGYSLAPKHKNVAAAICGIIALFIVLLLPSTYQDPINKADKAIITPQDGVRKITRSFLIKEGYEVEDKGLIVGPLQSVKIKTRSFRNHSLNIRTDRYFKGALILKDSEGKILQQWNVLPRGSLFDTISYENLPPGSEFSLEWSGEEKTDIGIFSIWTTTRD